MKYIGILIILAITTLISGCTLSLDAINEARKDFSLYRDKTATYFSLSFALTFLAIAGCAFAFIGVILL